MRSLRPLGGAILLCLLAPATATATAATRRASSVAELTAASARVFRGTCESVEIGAVSLAGARIPVTTYTFRLSEALKGGGGRTVTFRQAGVPGGGAADLGRLAGLPVYAPGHDYLLFLLPEGRLGLTSPAGAAEGAFEIVAGAAVPLGSSAGRPARPWKDLRLDVLREARR